MNERIGPRKLVHAPRRWSQPIRDPPPSEAAACGEVRRAARHAPASRRLLETPTAGAGARLRSVFARLEREATLLAAVNHPNVSTIHGIEERGNERFLVLELVEGPTLADRLARGPGRRAPSARHGDADCTSARDGAREGVIHRDVKTENIKLAANGQIKVLDSGSRRISGLRTRRPRVRATEIGTVMGTPAYMSPEQARGSPGQQSDIWSFGAVLFEMLTGKAPFRGATAAERLRAFSNDNLTFPLCPDRTGERASPAAPLSQKDPKRRSQHIGDVRIEIEDALAGRRYETDVAAVAAPRRFGAMPTTVAVTLAALAVGTGIAWALRERSTFDAPVAPVRLSIASLPPEAPLPFGTRHIAISHDGARVAYAGRQGLEIRHLSDGQTVRLGAGGSVPFFSPDGKWLGYGNSDAGIYKVPSAGGQATQIARFSDRVLGADWGADGTIVFATTVGLYRVPDGGGDPELAQSPIGAQRAVLRLAERLAGRPIAAIHDPEP